MGVIFASDACETCGYQPQSRLFYHGGKLGFFKGLATCNVCHELVSVTPDEGHIPNGFAEMFGGVEAHQAHVADMKVRLKLEPPAVNTCPICGGHDLTHHDVWEVFTAQEPIQIPCPRCEAGQLYLKSTGRWD